MKKTEIYVPIANKKEAKQAKAVLEALGEPVCEKYYSNTIPDCREVGLYYSETLNGWVLGVRTTESCKTTLKQLIELLVKESDGELAPNPEKIAVRVDNEKEFRALMKYYDGLGYVWCNGDKASNPVSSCSNPKDYDFKTTIEFKNRFAFNIEGTSKHCKIIPFAEFSKEHDIKLPLITSEDGVDLYEGDSCYLIDPDTNYFPNRSSHAVKLVGDGGKDTSCSYIDKIDLLNKNYKAFNTKQAAFEWIESQKPKYKDLNSHFGIELNVSKSEAIIKCDCGALSLIREDIKAIYKAMEELNNG